MQDLCPGQTRFLSQPLLWLRVQVTNLNQRLDELGEALVSQRSPNDGLCFWDVVEFSEGRRVPVRVCDKSERGGDVVGFGMRHEVLSVDVSFLACGKEGCGVEESEEDTARGPGEFVPQRVVGAFRSGETTTVG